MCRIEFQKLLGDLQQLVNIAALIKCALTNGSGDLNQPPMFPGQKVIKPGVDPTQILKKRQVQQLQEIERRRVRMHEGQG